MKNDKITKIDLQIEKEELLDFTFKMVEFITSIKNNTLISEILRTEATNVLMEYQNLVVSKLKVSNEKDEK